MASKDATMQNRFLIQAQIKGQQDCRPNIIGPPLFDHEQAIEDAKLLSADWCEVNVLTQELYWQQIIKIEKVRD